MDALQAISQLPGTGTQVDAKTKELGRDDFLTMFLAQLKNQDPLNPMEGQEFSAQLAQFSSLEQLFNVNETLQSMKTSQDDSSRLQALDFIGKEVVAKGDTLSLEKGETVSGQFELGETAECTVFIMDEEGIPVRSIPLGLLGAGSHAFQWDGHDGAGNILPAGPYPFQVVARTQDGGTAQVTSSISGTVTGVNLEGSGVLLYVGTVPVSMAEVMDIRVPSAVPSTDSSTVETSGTL
jgi:flagellar basal-body rod modification protein FlgD